MNTQTTMYRTIRIIWYIFGAIEVLLAFRFVLRLLGANPNAWFTDFIYSLSSIFLAPFRLVFGTPAVGGYAFELSTLLAIVVYSIIAWGIVHLIVMNRPVNRFEAHRELNRQDNA